MKLFWKNKETSDEIKSIKIQFKEFVKFWYHITKSEWVIKFNSLFLDSRKLEIGVHIVLNMQHITPNSKRWDHSDIPSGGHKKIKEPAHMVEGSQHLRKKPNPHLHITKTYIASNSIKLIVA